MFDRSWMVMKYVAVVRASDGTRFRVYTTGDPKRYLFDMVDTKGCSTGIQFPVEKQRLRDQVRRALSHGWGNSL